MLSETKFKKKFFVGTSDEENDSLAYGNPYARRSGVFPYGRHSPPPVRRRGASTSVKEKYFTDTPQTDMHTTSASQLSPFGRSGQRFDCGVG